MSLGTKPGEATMGVYSRFSGIGLLADLPLVVSGNVSGFDLPDITLPFDFSLGLPSLNFGLGAFP